MTEPRWLTVDEIVVVHELQLARFGGPPGTRDRGALESALARPQNKWIYEQGSLAELAAAYAFGIARSHPFVDGNKRVAFIAMILFLRLNGVLFKPPEDESTAAMIDLAGGDVDESGLARWIADRMP